MRALKGNMGNELVSNINRSLAQKCLEACTKYVLFEVSWGILGALCCVRGRGAPGTVALNNLSVTSHVLHQDVPLGLGIHLPLTGAKIPKSEKEGFGVKKNLSYHRSP